MNDSPGKGIGQVNVSTPERKKEYIKRWLEENPLLDACSTVDFNESTTDVPCVSSNEYQKQLLRRTPPRSPALSEKRSASSPIFGGLRKSLKRMKVVSNITKHFEEKPSCSKSILKEDCFDKDFYLEKDHESHLEKIQILELEETFNVSVNSDDSKHNNVQNNGKQIDPHLTQFIESVSSDNNTEYTEHRVLEVASDTDKTASDLIEEISSQLIYESPQKPKQAYFSQKISNPSSTSSEQTNDNHITESNTRDHTDPQCTQIFTPTDQIDSVSTLESKGESNKISYILQYTFEKPLKRKNPKKGSLLELLLTTMAKERSNVNLLRHQLYRNPLTVVEMPFVLLQTLDYLPSFNGNQFLKCILIEDTASLLKNLVKKKSSLITVMNVPELSNIINVKQKPVLKVYEPWTVVNPSQLILHITRFIAIPSSRENLNLYNVDNKVLKLTEEFYCPCIEKNVISNDCNSKFCDREKNSVKMICNHVP